MKKECEDLQTKIEFRFWDKERKKMIYPCPANLFPALSMTGEQLIIPASCGYMGIDAVVMLYSGRKDANGTKIYRDDIIQLADGSIGIVRFEKGIFYHTAHSEISGMTYWHKVIGNIHENPELKK